MNLSEPPTSLTLLGQLRQDKQAAAWGRFVQLYQPVLHLWAMRQGLQDADADDLVQDILVELREKLSQYDPARGKFRAWLFTVCKNRCRDLLRRRNGQPRASDSALDGIGIESPLSELEEVEYRQALVNRGLQLIRADFGEQTWRAFEHLHRRGRSAADVARELGLSVNAVYLAGNRVLTRLRQEINDFLD